MIDITQVLPDWDFVGGSTQSRTFQFAHPAGDEYDMQSGEVLFTVSEYVNDGTPVFNIRAGMTVSSAGNYCITTITIPANTTIRLSGCYTYQIMIADSAGNVAIPLHGRMHITKNLNPNATAT